MTPEDEEPGSLRGTARAAPSAQGDLTVGPPTPIETRPYDPEPAREKVRGYVAGALIAIFLALSAFITASIPLGWLDIAAAKELATIVLTPLFGLTSSAVGFYYGTGKR